MVYKSGDNEYFDCGKYGPQSAIYLKLIREHLRIKKTGVVQIESNTEINRLEKLKQKKSVIHKKL